MRVSLGPLHLELDGLDERRAGELLVRYGPYASAHDASEPLLAEALNVSVRVDPREYFLDPPSRPEFNPVFLAHESGRVRYRGTRSRGGSTRTAAAG